MMHEDDPRTQRVESPRFHIETLQDGRRSTRSWKDGFLSGGIVWVFGSFSANIFHPFTQGASIGYRCRPGHSEDALILNRKQKVEVLAPIIWATLHRSIRNLKVLFLVPF
jgi:hypothetical protein